MSVTEQLNNNGNEILWKPSNCLVTEILQNIIFYVQQKKETHTGLEQLEDE